MANSTDPDLQLHSVASDMSRRLAQLSLSKISKEIRSTVSIYDPILEAILAGRLSLAQLQLLLLDC